MGARRDETAVNEGGPRRRLGLAAALALVGALATAAVLVTGASAATEVITFDDLPPDTQVKDQYQARGVTFRNQSGTGNASILVVESATARSGSQLARPNRNCFAIGPETCNGQLTHADLSPPAKTVSLYVGSLPSEPAGSATATLEGLDAGGNVIASSDVVVSSGAQATTALGVAAPAGKTLAGFRLSRTDAPGLPRIAFDDLTLGGNVPPTARIKTPACGSPPCPLKVEVGKQLTLDASPSSDPDGSISRYQWDLDGNGSFERDGGSAKTTSASFGSAGTRTVGLKVTDNLGATGTTTVTVEVAPPACQASIQVGRLKASTGCFKPAGKDAFESSSEVRVNGIAIKPLGGTVKLTRQGGDKAEVSAANAEVSVRVEGNKVALRKSGKLNLKSDGKQVSGLDFPSFNGLKVTKIVGPLQLSADKISSTLEFYLALPGSMGGGTSAKPVKLTPGKAGNAALGAFRFTVPEAGLGLIGLEKLIVAYDGDGLWEIEGAVAMPPPIPFTVSAGLGLQSGMFQYGEAEVNFGTPGLGPFATIYLNRIKFRIEVKPNPSKPSTSKCVPKVGIETIDLVALMEKITGVTYDLKPRYAKIDHGVPDYALCGEVDLSAGPQVSGASALAIKGGLGYASYTDRPSVFRAFGKLSVVKIPLFETRFEMHSDGYVWVRADINTGIDGVVKLNGFISLEMLKKKFNAQAYVNACVIPVGLCVGAEGLLSSKGIVLCLRAPLDWSPGAGKLWSGSFKIYWSDCDVGPYKEKIKSARARAKLAADGLAIQLPKGLPGAAVTVTGEGAPPKVTLHGPNGETLTTPDDMQAVQNDQYWLIKDAVNHTTSFAIFAPAGGRWEVTVDDDSVPVSSVQSAEGLEEPKIKARVAGKGHARVLHYKLKDRPGQSVTFYETGPSAGTLIGKTSKPKGTLKFAPGEGVAEQRPIFAVVEQDGLARDRILVDTYKAPAARRPAKPRNLRLRRSGSAVKASWKRVPGAGSYEVRTTLSDGRRLFTTTGKPSVRVRGIKRRGKGQIAVTPISEAGMGGKTASAKIRGKRKRGR